MPTVPFSKYTDFRSDLIGSTKEYFTRTGIKRRDNIWMHSKAILFFSWYVVSWTVLSLYPVNAFHVLAASTSLWAVALFGLGFGVQHDANHRATSRYYWVNRIYGFVGLDIIGKSSHEWDRSHNRDHHTNPNIPGLDGDINYSRLVRLSEAIPLRWYHRYQHIYAVGLYSLAHLSFFIVDYARILKRVIAKEKAFDKRSELVLFILGKAIYYTSLAIPIWLYSWTAVFVIIAISMALSLSYQLVAQAAHVVDGVAHPGPMVMPEGQEAKLLHQLATTANFGADNRFMTEILGGLNMQAWHHGLVYVPHIFFYKLNPILKQVCKRWGKKFVEYPTFWAALCAHFRYLKAMGRPRVTGLVSG